MNISQVVKQCVGCGMCSSVCPASAVKMKFNKRLGMYKPEINKTTCLQCGKCLKYCPANLDVSDQNTMIGECRQIVLAHSANDLVRHNATSGGIISSVVCYILEHDIVEAVLLVKKDSHSIIGSSAVVITKKDAKDIREHTRDFASRYVVVPVLERLRDAIAKYSNICVVGTPCQINALSLKNDKGIIRLGLTCSGGLSYNATHHYKQICHGLPKPMYYRGNGWPGENCVEIGGGREIKCKHLGSVFEQMFSSQIFKNKGCRVCHDHFAENSDISFCDFWNKDEMENEREGNSCIIIRSKIGEKIFKGALNNKYIETVKQLSVADLINTQKQILKAKKGLKNNIILILFWCLVDFVGYTKLYRLFNIKAYRFTHRLYTKIVDFCVDRNRINNIIKNDRALNDGESDYKFKIYDE